MFAILTSLNRDDTGATMVEYGLLVAFVAVAALVGVKTLGTRLNTLFGSVAGSI